MNLYLQINSFQNIQSCTMKYTVKYSLKRTKFEIFEVAYDKNNEHSNLQNML